MCGGFGVLYIGYWFVDLCESEDGGSGVMFGVVVFIMVYFVDVIDEEIVVYVVIGELFGVVGVFMIDGLGGVFVCGIEGDYYMVVGVSLLVLCDLFVECGVCWIDLWVIG